MGLNYNPTIVPDGLVMYFDPANSRSSVGSGNTIYDLTGNSNTCTFSATPTYDVASKGNLLLAGYGTVAHTSTLWGSNQFPLSLWAKKIGAGSAGERGIMIAKDTNYIDHGYNNLTLASFKTSSSQPVIYGNAQASRNEWRHYATTYDGTLACLYENGALTGTTSFIGPLTSTSTPLNIGQWNGGGYNFNGKLGTMMTYNRALSAQEVKQNYDATKSRYISSPNIVRDGLVLYYDMSDYRSAPFTGTSIYDLSGSGNTGTLTNGPTYSGLNDGLISFDGSNDHIIINVSSSLKPATAITQEIWFKPDAQGIQHFIALQYASTDLNSYVLYYVHPDLRAGVQIGASFNRITIPYALTIGTWYHYVHTYDGSVQKLYVNGSSIGSSVVSGSITYDPSNVKLLISGDYNGPGLEGGFGSLAYGKMGSVRIYNRALTQQEVLQNYNATKSRFGL